MSASKHLQIQEQIKSWRRNRRLLYGLFYTGLISLSCFLFFQGQLERVWNFLFPALWCLGCYWFVLILQTTKLQEQITERLKALDDPRSIGVLAELREMSVEPYRADISAALLRLLPRLRPEDSAAIDRQQRKKLYSFFKWYRQGLHYNADLQIAILRALKQIGDERDMAFISHLVHSSPNPDVRKVAHECLPALHLRLSQARTSQALLRASQPPESAPDELLHPAAGIGAEPGQLLRASAEGKQA